MAERETQNTNNPVLHKKQNAEGITEKKDHRWILLLSGIIVFAIVVAVVVVCSQRGDAAQQKTSAAEVSTEKPVMEETVEESMEEMTAMEEQVELFTENLSDEEWFKSLNIEDRAVFLIFNHITGERKVIESGQEYTLQEGDELAFWYPLDWHYRDRMPGNIYSNSEVKFDCIFMKLNYENIDEKTEFILYLQDADRNDVTFNIYLSQ